MLVMFAGAAMVASLVGGVLGPSLIEDHPLLLLAIDSRNRHLALATATELTLWTYVLVGFVRLTITDPVFYLLGRTRGSDAMARLERDLPTLGRHVGRAERALGRGWGAVLVFAAPNHAVSAAAGHVGIPPVRFALLDVAGTAARLALIWVVGKTFATPFDWLLEAVSSNKVVITAALGGLLVLQLRRSRQGSS